jgi:uncharacterized protein
MALLVAIKVVPSSGRQAWVIDKAGTLKCYLKSPAERGLANQELVKRIATALRLPQASVTIVSGEISRNKRVKIEGEITLQHFMSALGLEQQRSIF